MFSAGFWILFSYRVRRLRKYGARYYFLLLPIDILTGMIRKVLSDTRIPSSTPVGPGLNMPHPSGIFISNMAEIGEQVSIFQQVTLGEWHGDAPKIGDNSSIFSGAKVFGGITIGGNCKIGANVTLNTDVPDNTSVSVGIPLMRTRNKRVVGQIR